MAKLNYKQESKQAVWIDESGAQIPYNRTTPLERLKERQAYRLYTKSLNINERLMAFKAEVAQIVEEVLEAARKANEVKLTGKGNFTWYNFDRSLKIEVNVNEMIKFDELTIESAREVLMELIRKNIQGDDFVISLVEDAFQTSRGKLDTRKVLGLKKHGSRIKDKQLKAEWDRAMDLIDKSISRPKSKTYYKVWYRDESGEYQGIELNFSSL